MHPRFVVHEHQARNLHWDLRLEQDGVLKSWAVPKGPPLEPGVKRLAIQVEDHELDYIDFEGPIPDGEYGAGMVEIWDSGTYELLDQETGVYSVVFSGCRMQGEYRLIRTKDKNWLLFKVIGKHVYSSSVTAYPQQP